MERDIFISIFGTEEPSAGLDPIKHEIFERIEGIGDVSRSSIGQGGWNIELRYESPAATNAILIETLKVFRKNGIVGGVSFNLSGRRYSLEQVESWFSE